MTFKISFRQSKGGRAEAESEVKKESVCMTLEFKKFDGKGKEKGSDGLQSEQGANRRVV